MVRISLQDLAPAEEPARMIAEGVFRPPFKLRRARRAIQRIEVRNRDRRAIGGKETRCPHFAIENLR
jgi:hypothetical protein